MSAASPSTADLPPTPAEWTAAVDAVRALPEGAVALFVGAQDRGKTTLVAAAARALAEETEKAAVVDADIGQSEIGPPATVGAAWAASHAPRLHDLKPAAAFFVGAFTPVSAALELVVSTGQAVEWARSKGARRVLVDTTGYVTGPGARRLKVAKAQAVRPAVIVAVQQEGEIDGLAAAMAAATGAAVVSVPVPAAVGRKSMTLRQTRRLGRLSQALGGAHDIALPIADIATVGAALGAGRPAPGHLARWAGTALRLTVVHAERDDDTLTAFVAGRLPNTDWESVAGPVADHFGARTVRAVSLTAYENVLLGLHDDHGRLLSLGRFVRLDPAHAELVVAASAHVSAERIRMVTFGRVRVAEDGTFLPDVRRGEI